MDINGKLLKPTLKKIRQSTTLSRTQVKAQTEAELAEEIIQKTKSYDKVLVLMSTTNIDRVTTLTRVANRTRQNIYTRHTSIKCT